MKKLTDEEFLENIKKRNYCVMITLPTCSVCHSIIEAHNGKLNLTDNVPHGCIFTFTLPLSEVTLNE